MKFKDLELKLRDGSLSESDLESECVTPEDFFKMRESVDEQWANGFDAPQPVSARTFRYVFVTESAIGGFRDVPLADGWDLKAFRERKSPILLQHDGLPIGRAGVVRKNQEFGGVKALIGHVQFAPQGISETADLTHEMVAAGLLTNGSVGFRVLKMREPTDEERKQFKMGKFSAIFERMSLSEFSVVGVGRDPKAGVMFSDDEEGVFSEIIKRGEYSEDAVMEVRDSILRVPEGKTTVTYKSVDEWLAVSDEADFSDVRASIQQLSERVAVLESGEEEEPESVMQSFAERVLARYENQEMKND